MPATAFPVTQSRDPYELVGRRIQRLITAPRMQKIQVVTVARNDDESPEAWQRVIQEIGETCGVRVEHLEGGTVRIGWREYCDA